jgi:transposase
MSEALDTQIAPLDKQLRAYARHQPGCRALMGLYGIGELTSVVILAAEAPATSTPGAARVALGDL